MLCFRGSGGKFHMKPESLEAMSTMCMHVAVLYSTLVSTNDCGLDIRFACRVTKRTDYKSVTEKEFSMGKPFICKLS